MSFSRCSWVSSPIMPYEQILFPHRVVYKLFSPIEEDSFSHGRAKYFSFQWKSEGIPSFLASKVSPKDLKTCTSRTKSPGFVSKDGRIARSGPCFPESQIFLPPSNIFFLVEGIYKSLGESWLIAEAWSFKDLARISGFQICASY